MSSLKDIMDVDLEPLESQAMRSRQAALQQNEASQSVPAQSSSNQLARQDVRDPLPISRRRSHRVSKSSSSSSQAGPLRPSLARRRSSGTAESMDSDGHAAAAAAAAVAGGSQMPAMPRQPSRGSNSADPIRYTPVTGRVSRAKKGQPVHVCDQCDPPRIFTRAEHLRRHQLGHQKPAFPCTFEDCEKAFHRPDLRDRHMNRHETQGEKAYKAGDGGGRESSASSSASGSPSLKSQTPLIVENSVGGGQVPQGPDPVLSRSAAGAGSSAPAPYDPMGPGLGAISYSTPSPQQNQYQQSGVGNPTSSSSADPGIGHIAPAFANPSMHSLPQEQPFVSMTSVPLGQMYATEDPAQLYPTVTAANGLPLLTLQVPEPPGLSFAASPWYSSSESTWSTPSDRHPSWARDRSTSVATNPDNWSAQPMVWSPHYSNANMQTPRTAGLEAVPESYESPPYVSPHLSPNASYPLAGMPSPAGGYQDIVARAGRVPKSELGRPGGGSSSMVELPHLRALSHDGGVVPLTERMGEYLRSYRAILEPIYAIIHPETFNRHPSALVRDAMAALGSQFHILTGDRENGSQLHHGCVRMIVPHAAWDLQTMQAIFLTEVFGRFRSQKIDVRPSAAFRQLYRTLVDASAADSASMFARFDLHEINAAVQDERGCAEVLDRLWQQWIEYEVRQRLRAVCHMFDSHQSFCYEQRRCQPAVDAANTFLVLPCPPALWVAPTAQQWYERIQTLDCAAVRLLHPERMTPEQISRLPLSSQADAGALVIELLPPREEVPLFNLNFDSNADIINLVVQMFPQFIHTRAHLALYHTPLHHLLSLTGNTWLFGQKLTSHSDIDAIGPSMRTWVSSPAAAIATWQACHLLAILFRPEGDHIKPFRGVSEYWFLYTMTLVVWAFGHRTLSLSVSSAASASTSRRASSVALPPDDPSEARTAAFRWCQAMMDLSPEQLPNSLLRCETGPVIDAARWRLREEAVMSHGRSGMLLDACGVLDRIQEGGRWF